MIGHHRIVVQNNKLHYELDIKRNITIIMGSSATGKTTLVDMVRQNMNLGSDSGIDVICDVPCVVLEGRNWQAVLSGIEGSIVFIDEGNHFVKSEEFASAIKDSDNYYVLITRENLYNLPYSVDEIYGIHSSGKYKDTRKVFQEMYRIYGSNIVDTASPQMFIVEDSNSGYDFFHAVTAEKGLKCISAAGKSNIYECVKKYGRTAGMLCVIADGAAFGAEMNRLYHLSRQNKNVVLYLPESFEWMLLQAELLDSRSVQDILAEPEKYIDSRIYFSWEQYFTQLLVNKTADTYLQYRKKKLNPVYLHEKIKEKILSVMPKLLRK